LTVIKIVIHTQNMFATSWLAAIELTLVYFLRLLVELWLQNIKKRLGVLTLYKSWVQIVLITLRKIMTSFSKMF